MPTLRDALVSALTLNIFIKNAEKVQMANVAQLINNLHCLFLAHEDKFTVTPNYHIFRMLAGHSGGTSLRTACVAPPVSWHYLSDDSSMPSISAAASIKGKVVTLSVVNASISEAHSTQVIAESATIASACSVTLTSTDIHAHNTFKDPDSVKPNSQNLAVSQPWVVTLPPASVTVFTIKLA
jgi:alpha-N-arabinofuranosidase